MAEYSYVEVNPSIIANTIMLKRLVDGVEKNYLIEPCDGYVLHDANYDTYLEYDEEYNPIGDPILGYRTTRASVTINYDFTANPRQFYAVPESEVPADQIFGGTTNPKPEVM
jgi:hypothetical protein